MPKIAIITNILAPYRVPVFSRVAKEPGVKLHVFCCMEREPDRLWDLPSSEFNCTILRGSHPTLHERHIHNNLDVLTALNEFEPDVIVTDGFNPIHLYAFLYASMKSVPHVPMTDGTDVSEKNLSAVHRMVRRYIYAKSDALISASQGGQRLYNGYHIPRDLCFNSCLCIDNEAFIVKENVDEKKFDFIFCGQIENVKNPLFVLDVALRVARRLHRKIRILYVGSGSQKQEVEKMAALYPGLVEVNFSGLATRHALPALYRSAKLMLFPTLWDAWDVVANEACAAGLPVIVSPVAGAAGELIRDEENGYVCELDPDLWADKAEHLLTDAIAYQKFSDRSRALVEQFTFESAAVGFLSACRHAIKRARRKNSSEQDGKKPRVLIVERQLLHYRITFYNRLRALLEKEGVELQLLIGNGTPDEEKKMDQVMLDWAIHIPTTYLLGTTLCWQPFGQYARDADLVIVMHENKIIYNLWLLSFGRPKRLAFWGHGRNMQSDRPNGLKERFKRWTINKVDWWFAYTDSSAALVAGAGFPSECTTVVENAVDTEEMTALCQQISLEKCQKKRDELQLEDGPVALYLGSLYKEKRLDFLLQAAYLIREKIPGFQLLVVGAGPEQKQIENAASKHAWIHYMGPLQGEKKAVALVLADVMLNPGLVGLGILDSFASGTPMFTTDCGLHSPEISYMASGKNGVMTRDDVDAYANAVIKALMEPQAIAKLSKGALTSAPRYTVDNMANRIRMGICACLAS